MRISQAFPSKWLKADDLGGREVKVVINTVAMEEIGEGADLQHKPVAYFKGKQKGLMLNKTNASMIADAYGDDTDDWAGHEVIIYPDKVLFQGKMVDCLRVRIPVARTAGDDEEAPF